MQSHAQPLLDDGRPAFRSSTPSPAGGFDIVVNGDHLLSWGIELAELQDAAIAQPGHVGVDGAMDQRGLGRAPLDQLRYWRRARCGADLLPDVADYLAQELGRASRALAGIPSATCSTAATLRRGDEGFFAMFSEFIVEQSGGADERSIGGCSRSWTGDWSSSA